MTVSAIPDHRCYVAEIDFNTTKYEWNSTALHSFIPMKGESYDSCQIFNGTDAVSCDKYVYDDTYYKSSRAIEWNFVCGKRWMNAIAQTSYMLGVFTGKNYYKIGAGILINSYLIGIGRRSRARRNGR